MARFHIKTIVTGAALLALASPAFAIESAEDCGTEGGTMVNVKGSDYCLVPIRPEEYRDEIYDGNQLGVVDCPGDKLNDGLYCLHPVTVKAEDESTAKETDSEDMPASETDTSEAEDS